MTIEGLKVLVTGGTGSLGHRIVHRMLTGELGRPAKVVVMSRDEAKQHHMRLSYLHRRAATDEVIYQNSRDLLSFRIGDVRDYAAVAAAVRGVDLVVHAAALKQVPTCEYFPYEAVQTNVLGALNLVRAIRETGAPVQTVIGISTDKACKPINVMGMTKALMERIIVEANLEHPATRFIAVRYGNVVASRGSVVPLFLEQIAAGGPITITLKEMTRFLLTLDGAVDTVFAALTSASAGEIYVPRLPAARVVDIARVLADGRDIPIAFTGIRPGEKVHEIMVSEEECHRTTTRKAYFVIAPSLPELRKPDAGTPLTEEYSSSNVTLDDAALRDLLSPYMAGFTFEDVPA